MECRICAISLVETENWAAFNARDGRLICKPCDSQRKKDHYRRNIAQYQKANEAWKQANPGRKQLTDAEYKAKNRAEIALKGKLKRDSDPKIIAQREERAAYREERRLTREARQKEQIKAWTEANRAKVLAYAANYRALKKNATPPDADMKAIQAIYDQAVRMSALLGVPYEVDHLVPISRGGLHHQDNLVIMIRSANRKKSARLLPSVIEFFRPQGYQAAD